jgi:glycosyltransferase involved in cell wall biosynthesis
MQGTTGRGRRASDPPSLLCVATVASTIRHFLLPYGDHFRALGWRVDAAANGATDDPALADSFDHVYELPLSRSILDLPGMASAERAIGRLLATPRDIVHVHTPIAGFVTRLAVRRAPIERRPAVIYTAHGFHFHAQGNPAANAVFLAAERLAGRWTDRLVVINDEDERSADRHQIVPRRRLVRVPGIGIDLGRYASEAVAPEEIARARGALRLEDGSPLILVIGELYRRKRPGDIVAALSQMRHKEAVVVFAGDGPARPQVERAAEEAGLSERVRLPGFVGDVRPLLGAASALVLASQTEGLPRAIMEALAMGVPVIASKARGSSELVAESDYLFAIGDSAALARGLDRLLDFPEEAHAMGLRGKARMMERYDLQIVIQRHQSLYDEVLAERGHGWAGGAA